MAQVVCFEGIDGAGKTTQIDLLRSALLKMGWPTVLLSYPVYTSFFGVELGHILSGRHVNGSDLDPKSMALWYALDRWLDYQAHPEAFGAPSSFVLLNRYTLSSMVYQSVRSNDPVATSAWVERLEHEVLGLPRPDLYVILDVPPTAGRANVGQKGPREYVGDDSDIYERDDLLQEKCRKLYLRLAEDRADVDVVPCVEGSAMRNASSIAEDVLHAVEERGLLTRAI